MRNGAILYPANMATMSLSEDEKRYLSIYLHKFGKNTQVDKMNDKELIDEWNMMCKKHPLLNETCATNYMKIKYLALDGEHKFGHLLKAPIYRHVPFNDTSRDVGIKDFGFVRTHDNSVVTVKDSGGYGMYQQCTYKECEKYPSIEDQSGSLFNWPYPNHQPFYCPEVAAKCGLNAEYHPEESKQRHEQDTRYDVVQDICDSELCKNIDAQNLNEIFDGIKNKICGGETDYNKIFPSSNKKEEKKNKAYIDLILLIVKWVNTYK